MIKTPTIALVLILLLVGLAGVGIYVYEQSLDRMDIGMVANSVTTSPTANWKSYDDATYNVSFKYPTIWGTADQHLLTHTVDSPWWDEGQSEVNFDQTNINTVVDLTSFNTYTASGFVNLPVKSDLQTLKDTYAARRVTSINPLWLPPSEAAIDYYSTPHYIESTNTAWRGEYYFAQIASDEGFGNPPPLIDMEMVLTDGKSNVVQLSAYVIELNTPTITLKDTCYNSTSQSVSCVMSSLLQNDFMASYQYFPDTLSEK